MATMWRKAMLYLGLGPDDEYDEYEPIEQSRTGACPPAAAPAGIALPGRVTA